MSLFAGRRMALLGLLIAGAVFAPRVAAAQWFEQLLGAWPIWHFGVCGTQGCFGGTYLCTIVQYGIVNGNVTQFCYTQR